MIRRRALAWALLAAATAACPRKSPSPHPPSPHPTGAAPDAGFTRACPDLPERRPADFSLRYSIHEYDHPENLARFALHDAAAPCPPDDMPPHLLGYYKRQLCLPMAAAAFDALYGILRREGIDRMRTRPLEPGPHAAGRLVELAWNGRRCAVGDVHRIVEVAPEQSEAMARCSDAIASAIRATAVQPPDTRAPGR